MSSPSPRPPGGLILVVAALLFAAMAVAAKAASHALSGTEVAFMRSAFGLVSCVGYHFGVRRLVARNRWGLFARGASGAVAVYAYFLAIEHLPVGIATLLNYTSPVFTAIWAALLFRQRLGGGAAFALLCTTAGLATVIHGQAPPGSLGLGVWEMTGLCAAILSGLSMVFIGELRKTDGSWEIFAAFSLATLLVSMPQSLYHWKWPSPSGWLWLGVMGLCSVSAQILMTFAMRDVSATIAGIVNQLTPVASLGFGWLLFDERFRVVTSFGIALTLLGGVMGAVLASRLSVPSTAAPSPPPRR